jgi:hypothetical protein
MHVRTTLLRLLVVALGPACTIHDPSEPGMLVAKTVDEDPTLGALDVNGTRLHVDLRGPEGAPVIVLLHGGPGGDFRYMLPLADPTLAAPSPSTIAWSSSISAEPACRADMRPRT